MATPELDLTAYEALQRAPGATRQAIPQLGRDRYEAPVKSGTFVDDVIGQDWVTSAAARMVVESGFENDDSWSPPAADSPEHKRLFEGVPLEFWDRIYGARSQSHGYFIQQRIKDEIAAEERLASYGGWGVAGRIALNLGDPVGLALTIATGGIGSLSKAERLAHAANALRLSGKFDEAKVAVNALQSIARSGAGSRALTLGLVAGAENAALETALVGGSVTRDGWDIALAGIGGLVLGTGIARVFTGRELQRVQTAFLREREGLQLAELEAHIISRREELLGKMGGDPAETRRTLDALTLELKDAKAAQARLLRVDRPSTEMRLWKIDLERKELEAKLAQGGDGQKLAGIERELAGLTKSRKALVQEIKSLSRKGKAVRPAEQTARSIYDIRARLRGEDEKVWGDQVDSPKVSRKREKEAQAELRDWERTLPADLKVEKLQKGLQTTAAKLEKANGEATKLRNALRASADDTALGREGAALRRALDVEDDVDGRVRRLESENTRLAGERTALEAFDGLDALRAAGVAKIDKGTVNEAKSIFGTDSASAARVLGVDESIYPKAEDFRDYTPAGRMKLARAAQALGTFSGILRGSQNEFVRSTLGRLVGNSTGNIGDEVNVLGASEMAARLIESKTAKFNTAVTGAYREWAEANGYGMIARQGRVARDTFMGAVGRAIRGEQIVSPQVNKAAAGIRPIFKEFIEEAKAAGVKGFENVEASDTYLPRVFDFFNLSKFEQTYKPDQIRTLFAGAIKAGHDDMDDALAAKIAKGYVQKMRELRVGFDAGAVHGMRFDDIGYLRRFLAEAGEDKDVIDELVTKFAQVKAKGDGKTSGGEGTPRYAKRRAVMDETYAAKLLNKQTGEWDEVNISDFFNSNVEQLFGRYSRAMGGHIGMAKAAGIASEDDFNELLRIVQGKLGEPGLESDVEVNKVLDAAKAAYSILAARPIQPEAGDLARYARVLRDWNFTTTMNQAGFAQMPDLAGLLAKGYLGHTLRHLPSLFSSFKRTDGSLDEPLAREMEEWLGLGTDYHNNAVFSAYDYEEEGLRGLIGSVHHGLKVAGRGTQVASGMAFVTSAAQRLAGRAIVQRLVSETLTGGSFPVARLRQLGIDESLSKRIGAQLRAHTSFADNEVGGKVRVVNWAKWDDVEARDGMLNAVFREARRIVQEEDLGDTAKWMHTWQAKVIFQFRRFGLVSYSKQLLHGIAHPDAETATRVALSMAIAGASYKAQYELKALQVPEDDREEYRAQYLAPGRIAAAAWARSSYASLTPALLDTITSYTVDERFFDVRTSGLGSDLVSGIPTYAKLQALGTVAGSAVPIGLRDDRQYTRNDARALKSLLPYQNFMGLDGLFNAVTADLPDKQVDEDREEVEWAF